MSVTNIQLAKDIKGISETLHELVTTVTLIDDRQKQDEINFIDLEDKVKDNTERLVGNNGRLGINAELVIIKQHMADQNSREEKRDLLFEKEKIAQKEDKKAYIKMFWSGVIAIAVPVIVSILIK